MIKLINICKQIGSQTILSNISITFPDTGLFVICGPSGCGKTTLLNIIAGLDNEYDGMYLVGGNNAKNAKSRFAYVNQKNMVLADESLQSNVEISAQFSNKKILSAERDALLHQVGLDKINTRKKTRLLSGGENQRLSLIMGIVKKSKVLLCDEITSKLDNENANLVIDKLKDLAKSRLVILVTHDLEIVKNKYTGLITLEDGKLISFCMENTHGNANRLPKNSYKKLDIKTLFKITMHKILTKKKRVSLCIGLLSIGLVAFSLSLFISKTLKQNLDDAFSSFINKDEIIMRHKLKNDQKVLTNINYEEYKEIFYKYPDYFTSIGVEYITNIDSLLDQNECKISFNNKVLTMPNISISSINGYEYVDDYLESDEINLIFNQTDLKNFCMFLRLEKSDCRIVNEYLLNHMVLISFYLGNSDWSYKDSISFKIQNVTEGIETKIAHSNPLFNEYVYEELMRFKNIDEVIELVPWALDKQYFMRSKNNDVFLEHSFNDDFFKKYYPSIYNNHIKFFQYSGLSINNNDIMLNILNKTKIKDIKISTNGSYLILDESSISGFSSDFLLTNDKTLLDETIELNSTIDKSKTIKYPSNIFLGNITNLSGKNINFSSDMTKVIGNKPTSNEEIVISSRLAKEIFDSGWKNQELYVGFLKEKNINNNMIKNNFSKTKLRVVGIVDSDKYLIYQNYYWLIGFFRDNLGVENERLIVDAVQFSLDNGEKIEEVLKILNNNDIFEYKNSSENISSTIQETIEIAKTILLFFSYFTIFLSLIMLTLILYLFKKENVKDFAAIYALGGMHDDVINYKYMYALFVIVSAFLTSLFALSFFFIAFKYANIAFFSYSFNDIVVIFLNLLEFVALICFVLRVFFLLFSKKNQNIAKIMQFYE
ncbi:MAG: ATP-binding cassette domain-containing protein [Erysipelotrichales bacterium]|nr:ATP-binding cassette domain-containing protein [Erysipelotrichales bacterium]